VVRVGAGMRCGVEDLVRERDVGALDKPLARLPGRRIDPKRGHNGAVVIGLVRGTRRQQTALDVVAQRPTNDDGTRNLCCERKLVNLRNLLRLHTRANQWHGCSFHEYVVHTAGHTARSTFAIGPYSIQEAVMVTDGAVLAAFLKADRKRTSLRAMEVRSRVPRTTLDTLIKRRNTRLPQYETLQKLAAAFSLALWKVAEMAGVLTYIGARQRQRQQRQG
jgi:hypothetical protein